MAVGKRQRASAGQRQRAQLTPSAPPPCMGHGELRAEAGRLVARAVHDDELHFLYTTYRGMCERGAWLVRAGTLIPNPKGGLPAVGQCTTQGCRDHPHRPYL